MVDEPQADLRTGGREPGPFDDLPPPRTFEQDQRQRRMRLYHLAVIRGKGIRFIPSDYVL